MAAALSRYQAAIRNHKSTLRSSSGPRPSYDPERFLIGTRAMEAPRLTRLKPLSPAWFATLRMLDCYATLDPKKDDEYFLQLFDVSTCEEVAEEQMLRSLYPVDVHSRAFSVAAVTALHCLNWARQHAQS